MNRPDLDRERDDDWFRGEMRERAIIVGVIFYGFAFLFGTSIFLFAAITLSITRLGWGHGVALLIGGLFMMALSPYAFWNDVWRPRR